MKHTLTLWAVLCLWVGGSFAAALVDDFESYAQGPVGEVTDIWEGTNSIIQADPADASNQVLRVIQQGGQSGTYAVLPPEAFIAEGQTKTLFFRFRVNADNTD